MKWLLTIAIAINFVGSAAYAQENTKSKLLTEFSFTQLTGGVVLLKGIFNDIPDSLNFILDTGSGAISIDSSTVVFYKIPNVPSDRTVSGIAGIKEVNFAKNNTLHLPGLSIDSLDFFVNDYTILSSVYGIKIDGVIGYSFLSKYIVELNYDKMRIKVYSPGIFKYPRRVTFLHPLFTALPILTLSIKDIRPLDAHFYLDTGAGLCFLLTDQFIKDSMFLKKGRKPVTIQVQGFGGKKQMELTVIDRLKLGRYTFKNVPTNILKDDHNALSYPMIGGLLGNDILRRFNVILNYQKREIAIKPNSHYKDPFDYSYTGMNMYMEDGVIVVDDIVAGSPADKGGIKNGDVIVGINNNFSNDISAYKNLVQSAGKKVTLIVSRDGELITIEFRVGYIY